MIGIDFGTSTCLAARVEGGDVRLLLGPDGEALLPSAVGVEPSGNWVTGSRAKSLHRLHPDRSILQVKRRLGIEESATIGGKSMPLVEIASKLFNSLRTRMEEGSGVTDLAAVVTVPAHFLDAQRRAVREAARLAGFDVKRIISEPVAAALTLAESGRSRERLLVFDLGGGTFDVSILEIEAGVWEVLATGGDDKLGGVDFDRLLRDLAGEAFRSLHGIDPRLDPIADAVLWDAAEKVKIQLSTSPVARFSEPFLSADADGPRHLDFEVSRAIFESLLAPFADKAFRAVEQTLTEAKLDAGQIDRVLLVGGSAAIPLFRREMKSRFPSSKIEETEPMLRVVKGAAIQAALLEGRLGERVLVDVAPFSMGIEIDHGYFAPVIPKNTAIPAREERLFTTLADGQSLVEVHILQGEKYLASENASLGRFQLEDIRNAPQGVPRIRVIFDLDVDGLLTVSAMDVDTGKSQKVRIQAKTG